MSRRVVINTESVNRSGYRILNAGAKTGSYLANPVLLYNHDRSSRLPIGKLKDLKLEGGKLSAEPEFDMQDTFAAEVARKWEAGILNAASMGINILAYSEDPKDLIAGQTRHSITSWDLLEVSIVDIPRNQDCVKLAHGEHEDTEVIVPLIGQADQPTTLNHSHITMDKNKIALALGLGADATDEQLVQAVTSLKASRAATLLSLGRANGSVTDANAKQYEALAVADFDSTLSLLSVAPAPVAAVVAPAPAAAPATPGTEPVTVESLLKAVQAANGGAGRADDPNDRSKWTFDDYQRRDADALLKMKNEQPAQYKALVDGYKP
jgi:phage head maturation protease